MLLDERLFNEVEFVQYDDTRISDEYFDDIAYALTQKYLQNDNQYQELTNEYEKEEYFSEIDDELYQIGMIKIDSILYLALLKFYKHKLNKTALSPNELADCFNGIYQDHTIMFDASMSGCDLIDTCLFNGNGSGENKQAFLDYINNID